eukprot:PhM_4_TR14108/c3_g1_i1/m.95267
MNSTSNLPPIQIPVVGSTMDQDQAAPTTPLFITPRELSRRNMAAAAAATTANSSSTGSSSGGHLNLGGDGEKREAFLSIKVSGSSGGDQWSSSRPSGSVGVATTTTTTTATTGKDRRTFVPSKSFAALSRSRYARHPSTLLYLDLDVEARYCNHVYIQRGHTGKVLWHVVVLVYLILAYTVFPPDGHVDASGFAYVVTHMLVVVYILSLLPNVIKPLNTTVFIEAMGLAVVFFIVTSCSLMAHDVVVRPQLELVASMLATFFSVLMSQLRFLHLTITVSIAVLIYAIWMLTPLGDEQHHPADVVWIPLYLFAVVLQFYLERRSRDAFEQIERAADGLQLIEDRTEIIQEMLANFFPPTPTEDFFLARAAAAAAGEAEGFNSRLYAGTALIVTDAVGFTAWSNRTETSIVVKTLGMMFTSLDAAATTRNVEKITTVGDSFVGAVFPTKTGNLSECGQRCVQAIRFGIAAANLPGRISGIPLRFRIGVHVGDLVGGFVGLSPPVFDLFGYAMDYTKHMESTGEASRVHVSFDAMTAAKGYGDAVDALETEEGVLLSDWADNDVTSPVTTFVVTSSTNAAFPPDQQHNNRSGDVDKMEASLLLRDRARVLKICDQITAMAANAVDPAQSNANPLSFSGNNASGLEHSRLSLSRAFVDVSRLSDESTDAIPATLELRPSLSFVDRTAERMFFQAMRRSGGLHGDILYIFLLMGFYGVLLLVAYACNESDNGRVVLSLTLTALTVLATYMRWGAAHAPEYVTLLVLWLVFSACGSLIPITSTGCFSYDHDKYDTDVEIQPNIYYYFMFLRMIAPHLMYTTPMWMRLCAHIATLPLILMDLATHHYALDDPVLDDINKPWQSFVLWLIVPFLSYSIEKRVRLGFAAQQRVFNALHSSGQYATASKRAMYVMLPRFVANTILRGSRDELARHQSGKATTVMTSDTMIMSGNTTMNTIATSSSTASSPDMQQRGGTTFMSVTPETLRQHRQATNMIHDSKGFEGNVDLGGDLHLRALDDVAWEYNMVCVCFVTFHLSHDRYEDVQPMLGHMEEIVLSNHLMKVKTINTTMLFAGGLEVSQRQIIDIMDVSHRVCRAVIEMAYNVFSTREDCHFTAGVHCGPCFGAVLGVNGLTFDVFGDTINTASRMQTTAERDTIQFTTHSMECLGIDPSADSIDLSMTPLPSDQIKIVRGNDVEVKGKGTINVFKGLIACYDGDDDDDDDNNEETTNVSNFNINNNITATAMNNNNNNNNNINIRAAGGEPETSFAGSGLGGGGAAAQTLVEDFVNSKESGAPAATTTRDSSGGWKF